ncbi:TPA: restriction endonuclease subunit S [Enterobacter kobei]|uniref:restriction endonuclease subunit S n=1 Tax=Enterobacter kobei TaxID=208224 RepID=UPI0018A564D7|nr:restriction endonuclease subunit S [Enterobacter kobei]ELK3457565.1 restriction endonuclease subunit S [Enterobacter kobei]BBV85233.1 type I restriction system specificity protein [Enterobacter kobei]HDT4041383.1 restriction endonuclease subunit S [Enterobacter kobei]
MGFDFQLLENAGIQLIDGDRGKNYPKHNDFIENGYCLFLSAKNVTKSGFQFQETAFINETKDCELRAGKLKYGDIVLTTRGTVGNVAYYDNNNPYKHIRINSGMIIIRADSKIWNPKFLYFILTSIFLQKQIVNLISGSAVPQLPARDIKKLILPVISKNIQDKISNFVSALNDKIIVNIGTNKTLEKMSQTLFKSWFVDFDPVIDNALDAGNAIPEVLQSRADLRKKIRNSADFTPQPANIRALFPDEFEETELGWVPKSWITTSFNDLIELIGGGTPKTSVEEYWNGNIPWFSVVDVPNESDIYVLTTEKNITTEGLKNSSAKLLRKGTTIISARGTVGKCAMVAVPMAMNQSCYGVIGKNNISDEYIYFQLKNAVQTLQQMGHGSVFNTITRDTFKNIKVPFCNEELTNSYSLLVKNYFSKILNNNYQNIALTNLRDTLLPKLISGELSLEDLPDIIKQTEAA